MTDNIKKAKEELKAAYEIAHSDTLQNMKVIRTLTREYVCNHCGCPSEQYLSSDWEEELDYNQDFDAFIKAYDPKITHSIKVIGNYHGCKITLHIHR